MLSKIRERLGLDQAAAVNGGGAHAAGGHRVLPRAGRAARELQGRETCDGTCNRPDNVKIGTVGPPAPDVEVTLADDGEVLVRSDVVMKGYRNQREKTAEALDSEGRLHTGDIGEFDDDGFLRIVDRKKELIINVAGATSSPANIEVKAAASSC